MVIFILGWGSTFLIMLVAVYFYVQNWRNIPPGINHSIVPPVTAQMSSGVLFLAGALLTMLQSSAIIIRTSATLCLYGSAIIPYYVHNRLFKGKNHPILHSKLLHITFILTAMVIYLDHLRGDNIGSFIIGEPFESSFVYYAYWGLGFFIPLYLCATVAWMFWKYIFQYIDAICVFRRIIGFIAFSVATLCCVIIEINLIVHIFKRDTNIQMLNTSFFLLIPLMGILLTLYVTPHIYLTRPISWVRQFLRKKVLKAKKYVYPVYITAAPGVSRYGAAELHERGMDAEIEQARYIIWSHQANITPITPEMDAGLLLNIRRAGVVYHKIGPCPPQPLRDDADTHILAVARALRREKKNNSIVPPSSA